MKTLIYNNTVEGFLTSIFYCYEQDEFNVSIKSKSAYQTSLFEADAVEVEADDTKASRVKAGIIKKTNNNLFNEIATVFCSNKENKDTVIFEYLKLIFAFGTKARLMLNNPSVIAYNELLKKVTYERHRMIGFMRFEETKEGIMYAKFSPDNNITHLLLSHFANRFSTENFIIHDTKRNVLGVYSKAKNKFFTYTSEEQLSPINLSSNEAFFQKLWQNYYKDAAIMERENTRAMLGHMPKRYHTNMTEHKAVA
jgi:probable DNA metabolism protein